MRKILFNLVATFLYANIVYAEEATVTIGTSASATYAATFTSSSTHAKITASATSFSTGSGTAASSSTYSSATAPYSAKFKPSANINTSDWNDNYSIYAQFSVSSGYTFSPTSISATIVTEAANYTYQAILTDGITTYTSSDVTSSANGVSTFSFPSLTGTALSGNVTFRIRYKSTANNKKFFVVNLPITIVGNVASSGPSYSITYNCDGGTVCPSTVASATTLPNPLPSGLTKSGYAFVGWFTDADKTVAAVAGADIAANTTLYAKWVTAYTLTWNLAGGKVTTAGTGAAVDATGTPSIALAAGAAITTPVVAKDYHAFDAWSSTPASTMPSSNTTYTAQWTPLYASGTYTFENNASAGTAPNKLTMTDGTKVSVAAGSRVDNLFFSAQDIKYESGVYGGDGDDFKGWKINTNGATISFLVENDCDVTFGVGNLTSGATVSYTNQSGTPVSNSALTAKTDNTFSVKGGTVVTFKTSGGSTVTLKKIAITAACTSHSVTAATSTGNNTYGTVSAASATVCEGSTTTVTAVPAAGYQVTNWAVSDGDNGASISPTGASNSNTTTLTMGTANATVTVTFGCKAPTSPDITGTTAYTEGQDISLTADASDKSASATYTWYKGTTWDAASAADPVQPASTSGATFTKASSVAGDAGTYWCEISNGTGCNAHESKTITVGPACTDPGLTITLN